MAYTRYGRRGGYGYGHGNANGRNGMRRQGWRRSGKKYSRGRFRGLSKKEVLRMVRQEASRGPRLQHFVSGYGQTSIQFAEAGLVPERYFCVPVTRAVPPLEPKAANVVSQKFRHSRKVMVTGFTLNVVVNFSCKFQFSAVMHRLTPNMGAPAPVERGNGGIPTGFVIGVKEDKAVRLMTLDETRLASREGPYEVKVVQGGGPDEDGNIPVDYSLATVDGSPFDCPLSSGAGAPIGKVDFSVGERGSPTYRKTSGARTVNLEAGSGVLQNVDGVAFEQVRLKAHWKLSEAVEYEWEGSNALIANGDFEVKVYLSPAASAYTKMGHVAGIVEAVQGTVYYRDMYE